MKNSILRSILFLTFILLFINAKWKDESNPGIIWSELNHDFGDISQGQIVETNFVLTNTTKDTLSIENVQGSCGCLASNWNRESILPNGKASIVVKFDPKGKLGKQYKSLSVYTSMGAYYLGVTANVIKKTDQ